MLENLRYINHMNESLDFGKNGLFVNENDLRDFTWGIKSKNDRISGFKKGIVSKTIPIIIKCETQKEGFELRNKLFEICEKDILTEKHGRIIIGDFSMKCFITESKKSEYLIHGNYMRVTMKVTTDFPYWCKEHCTTFNYGSGSKGKNLDFKRDFPSDFTSNLVGKVLKNTSIGETNFKINIYGPCINPKITIGGHTYGVDVTIGENEQLSIDSEAKKIILTHIDGTKENCFKYRKRDFYIFQKIKPGIFNVSANADYKFDTILLEERSEPLWI